MTQTWHHLSHLQIGKYAEYFFKMHFVLLGLDVYTSEVDDRGIDFVLRAEPDRYWDVQVKSIRNARGYVFFPKNTFGPRENLLAAIAWYREGHQPDLFLIRSVKWQNPEYPLVDRPYVGKKSKPEFGLSVTRKTLPALEQYRLSDAMERVFGREAPPNAQL